MIQRKIRLRSKAQEAATLILKEALADFGCTVGDCTVEASKGIYTWDITTPKGTPLENLRIGFDTGTGEYTMPLDKEEKRDKEPRVLLKSIRLSPTVSLKTPAI